METAALLSSSSPSPAPSINSAASTTATAWTTLPSGNQVTIEEPKPTLSERELLKLEYYSTYDAMTGIRIAATLGGFFSLMVFLVVYKSRCRCRSSRKSAISEEELAEAVAKIEAEEKAAAEEGAAIMAAVAAAVHERGGCAEGDDAPLEAYYALMARSGFSRRAASFSIPRQSIGSINGPTPRASCGNCASFRQRSLRQRRWGSGSGARMPRRRRGKSLPGYPTFGENDAPDEATAIAAAVEAAAALTAECRNEDDSSCCYLEVPRRLSSVGSGSVSSYLEKRGSVVLLGLPAHPPPPPPRPRMATPPCDRGPTSQRRRRRRRESSRSSASASFPIDINVIQPTPDVSPRGSERQLDRQWKGSDAPAAAARALAPLASIGTGGSSSSAASSLSSDCCPPGADFDARSVGSDSVFFDESSLAGSRRPSSVAPISSDSDDGVPQRKPSFLEVPTGTGEHPWERGPPIKQNSNFLRVPSPNLRPISALPRTLAPPSPRPPGRWCTLGDSDGGFASGRRVSAPARHPIAGRPSCDTISAQVSATPLATTPESPPSVMVAAPGNPCGEDVRSTGLYRPYESTTIQPAERPSILHLDAVRTAFRPSPTFSSNSKLSQTCLTPPRGAESLSFPMFGGSCEHLTVPDKGSRETLF